MAEYSTSEERTLPLLPLRDIVLFPTMLIPLTVGREQSVEALEAAKNFGNRVFAVTQIRPEDEDTQKRNLYEVGTVAEILQTLRLPEGKVKVLVEGVSRAHLVNVTPEGVHFEALIDDVMPISINPGLAQESRSRVLAQLEYFSKLGSNVTPEFLRRIRKIEEADKFTDMAASQLTIGVPERQRLLEMVDVLERLELLSRYIDQEIDVLLTDKRIKSSVKRQMEGAQREYFLNEQLKAIRKELGRKEDIYSEVDSLKERIRAAKMPAAVEEKALNEVKRLETMSPMFAEATVVRTYIDWLLSLPWNDVSKDNLDPQQGQKILDEDHYGLEDVKERIIEYLAVQKRLGRIRGPILCFVGPPGVGKTSLGKSIARAIGRKFVRMSLGGVRDEAEIRGHRRTYIGSLPGRIIQAMKKAEKANPVILLDEIDKLGADFRGDPASALLEVLDPEQNETFNDHYLEIDYDLSKVMFITTANVLEGIPRPLLDRMEVIRIPGYTEEEKLHIASEHLIPKVAKNHGIEKSEVELTSEALTFLIRHYTREAGVRNLEREIGSVYRKAAVRLDKEKKLTFLEVTPDVVREMLGPERFKPWTAEEEPHVGVATGLAWTEVGGLIMAVESLVLPGKGNLRLTGKLGDTMQESGQAALAYIRSRAEQLGLEQDFYQQYDLHVHVPEGAVPKDGPSAGITIATSIVSALTGNPVRHDVAMTGEVTLRGHVLKIGGLKEKVLAAHRVGIREVLLPEDNRSDLEDIPEDIRKQMTFHPVSTMDQVLNIALVQNIDVPMTRAEKGLEASQEL